MSTAVPDAGHAARLPITQREWAERLRSRLSNPSMLDLLTSRPPHRVTLSIYGATEESYDGLT